MPEPTELEKRERMSTEKLVFLIIAVLVVVYIAGDCIAYSLRQGFDGFWERLGVGIGAICTIGVYSFLYRENPVYRFLEHILVGLSVGYATGVVWTNVLQPQWLDKMTGAEGQPSNYLWLLVLIPGVLWYFQLSKRHVWLSRLVIMFFMGTGAGGAFRGTFQFFFGERGQVIGTFKPIVTESGGALHFTWLNFSNLVFIIVVLCVLSYFFFTLRHEGNPVLRATSRLGRYFLMICFGTIFGTTVQGRMSLFIDRLVFLYHDWLGIGG